MGVTIFIRWQHFNCTFTVFTSAGFGGCIKDVKFKPSTRSGTEAVPVDLRNDYLEVHNVHLDGCPRQVSSDLTCRSNVVGIVYSGPNNATFDYGLEPFTGKCLEFQREI